MAENKAPRPKKPQLPKVKKKSQDQQAWEEAFVKGWEYVLALLDDNVINLPEGVTPQRGAESAWLARPKPIKVDHHSKAVVKAWEAAGCPEDGILVDGVKYRVRNKLLYPTLETWK